MIKAISNVYKVVIDRYKKIKSVIKNLPKDKKLALFSTIFVFFAIIGYILLNYLVQSRIDEFRANKSDYLEKQMMSFDFINKSNYHIKDSYILDDHYHIIKLLDSKNKYLLDSIAYKEIQVLRNAAYDALNSAISSEQIDHKNSEALFDEIDFFADSLKSKKKLLNKYKYYNKKGASGTIDIQKNIDKIEDDISRYTTIKNILWIVILVFQSGGMVLGVWASVVNRR